jgi:hypothetical protein
MTYPAEVLADSPAVYWRLGESSGVVAADQVASYDGTYVNGPTLGVAGLLGGGDTDTAVSFDYSTGMVVTPTGLAPPPILGALTTMTEWTIEFHALIRTDDPGGAELVNISGDTLDWFGVYLPGDGTVRAYGTSTQVFTAVDLGVAHHYVFVYDGTNNLLYVDGVLVDSNADIDYVLSDTYHYLFVGGASPYGGISPDATIDEVAYYNTALSAGRILAHYDAAFPVAPPDPDPVVTGGLSGASAAALGILNDVECNGTLTINGVLMHNQAWAMIDLGDLWLPPKTRGSNVVIPGAVGRRAYPVRADETTYSLPMLISGVAAPGGVMYSDAMVGLETNIGLLADVFVPDPNVATVTASLEMPSGAVRTAEVQIVGVKLGKQVGPVMRAILEMVVPAGGFA